MSFTTHLDMGELGDQQVTVEYDYIPGYSGSLDEPPRYPETEITSVKWLGVEILALLKKLTIERLVEEAFDNVLGVAEQAKEDQEESRNFDREAA